MSTYATDDIRSRMAGSTPSTPSQAVDASTPVRPSQWIEFRAFPPADVATNGSRTWFARAANLVIAYTDARAGDVFTRSGQPDEYAVLMYSESAPVTVTGGGVTEAVAEEALIVVPPGDSEVRVDADGTLIRLFSSRAEDLCARSVNAAAYAEPDDRVAPLRPAPEPVGGFGLRVYRLADTPIVQGRFGRIFRTTSLMVNFLAEEPAPRDAHKLSPHHHEDFEQVSLAVKGRFTHHIRYPWGPDSTRWRPDEHREIGSPSICVIPPPTVHTTQGIGPHQQLIDIFAPPRDDFAASGWVLNSDDYPAK